MQRAQPSPEFHRDADQDSRDRTYAELRAIAEQCERLAHRVRLVSTKIAERQLDDEGQR